MLPQSSVTSLGLPTLIAAENGSLHVVAGSSDFRRHEYSLDASSTELRRSSGNTCEVVVDANIPRPVVPDEDGDVAAPIVHCYTMKVRCESFCEA